jgi:hypothetical protein
MKISRRLTLLLIAVWGAIILTSLAVADAASMPEAIDRPALAQAESPGVPVTLAASQAFTPNAAVGGMISQVQQSSVYSYTGQLSGEWPALVGGELYTITTRHTDSGVPIQKATQYVYEHMQALSLTVGYHDWTYSWRSNRNVSGILTGSSHPDEVVLVTAHLDDQPYSGLAPGADDNASGSVGALVAADILSQYQFERTLRFVFFTGEEQGHRGSNQYAQMVHDAGENIVAVYNMDMIAWNSDGNPTLNLHTRTPSDLGYAGDLAIAGVFTNVVSAYGLSSYLTPMIVADGESRSDHSSFWNWSYSAILAIEDDVTDFNDYYHTSNDRLQSLDMTYFTNFVKASVGTVAHLARPLSKVGLLTGVISDAATYAPLAGTQVRAESSESLTYTQVSDSEGVYSLTLPVGTYSVTGLASGYWPKTILDVAVVSTTTRLDIPLAPVRIAYIPIVFKNAP